MTYGDGNILHDTKITAIVSRDADGNELAHMDIPVEVQELDGYGKGIPDVAYNSVEVSNEGNAVFINRISCRLGSWGVSYFDRTGETLISTVATDGSAVNNGAERVLCNKFPFAKGALENIG
jgi:hypothetical protein